MAYKYITFEKKPAVATIRLNRPEDNNALGGAMADELAVCCRLVNEDPDLRVTILQARGNAFSVGRPGEDPATAAIAANAIASLKIPVIASIQGDAIGSGLELALACDIRIAVRTANFGFEEVSYGSIPSGGGTQRLPRIVGRGKALELILTASTVDGNEAGEIGLVNRIVDSLDDLVNETESLAGLLASKGPIAERYAKEAIGKGLDMTLSQGLGLEADLSFILHSSTDRDEGINAFKEKRTPNFTGE